MINYILIAVIILLVDLPWLILGSNTSSSMIKKIQGVPLKIRYIPTIIVYLALSYLVTLPNNTTDAFLLGLSTFAVYDFTNYATLKNYSLQFALMDSLWGGILFAIVHNILKSFNINTK